MSSKYWKRGVGNGRDNGLFYRQFCYDILRRLYRGGRNVVGEQAKIANGLYGVEPGLAEIYLNPIKVLAAGGGASRRMP